MDQEGEEVAPNLAVALSEALAVPVRGAERHDGVEVAVEAPAVLPARAGRQGLAPARQQNGPEQQRLHAWREDGVSGIDGELAIAELVGEAHLPQVGMTLLGAEQVRHPDGRAMAAHHLGHHAGAPALAHDVDHHLLVLEHPVPAGPPIDPHARLVRAHDPRPAQPGQDGRRRVVEGGLGAAEQGIERTFADGETEQVLEQAAEPLVADGVGEAQVERHGHHARPKGRALLHPVRDRRQGGAAAAGAASGVALYARHHGAHPRQLDPVVTAVEVVIRFAEVRAAVPASGRLGAHDLIGLRHQAAATALAAQAALARAGRLGRVGAVRLLPLGRRQTGVVRCLRRVQPLLQGREPRRQRHDLLPQRDDQRVLLRVAQRRKIGQRRDSHSKVESRFKQTVKPSSQPPFRARSRRP